MTKKNLSDFAPSLRNVSGNSWEASTRLPVVGLVSVIGDGWPDAKLKLWLVAAAVQNLAAQACKQPKDWNAAEWKAVMKTLEKLSTSKSECLY